MPNRQQLSKSGQGDGHAAVLVTLRAEVQQMIETAHLLLMRTLAARGNVAEALAAYERLRVLLRDELGVNPCQAVQDAHAQLLD